MTQDIQIDQKPIDRSNWYTIGIPSVNMAREDDKMIRVSNDLHGELDERRRPKETFEAFIWRLLDRETPQTPPPAPAPAPAPPAPEREPADDRDESDLIRFVRENQPVERSEIIEECVPDDFHGKPDSWWQRHGRAELNNSDAEYKQSVGWIIEK